MKASDVVTQMALLLPQLTGKFTSDVSVTSLSRSGTVMTAACDEPHLLKPGDAVSIVGAVTPIVVSDLKRTGEVGTLVTAADHDVSSKKAQPNITISGSPTSEFNGSFAVIDAPDRRTIRFSMEDSGPTTGDSTGTILEDGESPLRLYNTAYSVLETPTPTTFTFIQPNATIPDPVGTITARTKPRVAQGVDPDRIVALYTEKLAGELWAFVVLEDVPASKSRSIASDAIDNLQPGTFFRQQVIQPFTIYLFVPVSESKSGMAGRDEAEDLFRDVCRSVLFGKFDSGLAVGEQGPVQFVSHGTFRYDTAVYVHAYSFQQVVDLSFEDTVGPDLDVAFRCIDLKLIPQLDGEQFLQNSAIDLDPGFEEQDFSTQHGTNGARVTADPIPFYYANTVDQMLGIANVFSFGVWFNPLNVAPMTPPAQGIFEIQPSSGEVNRIRIRVQAGGAPELEFRLWDSAGVLFKDFSWREGIENPLIAGSFQMLLFTYDGSSVVLYHDGAAVAASAGSIDDPGTMTDTARRIFIGAVDQGAAGFDGMIHSIGVWNVALGAAEALALYNGGDGRAANWYADFGAYVSSDDLPHWWRLGLDPNDPGKDYGVAAVPIDVDQNAVGELTLRKSAP